MEDNKRYLIALLAVGLIFLLMPYYLEWIGERKGSLVDHDFIIKSFDSNTDYLNFVREFQGIRDEQSISRYLFVE